MNLLLAKYLSRISLEMGVLVLCHYLSINHTGICLCQPKRIWCVQASMLLTKWFTFNCYTVCLIRTKACENCEGEPCFCMKQIRRWWFLRVWPKSVSRLVNLLNIHNMLQVNVLWMVLLIVIIRNVILFESVHLVDFSVIFS